MLCWIACVVALFTLVHAQMQLPFQLEEHSPLGIPLVGPPVLLDARVHQTDKIPFIPHTEDLLWLGQELNFSYIKPIFVELSRSHRRLQSRDEAHITVISPPEYNLLSNANITIDEINGLAAEYKIQESAFEVMCLGRVKLNDNVVYQLVVRSPDLVRLRTKIFQLYWHKGGNPALFDPESFWPHVTVGYTEQDVFIENGVYKGHNICWRAVKLVGGEELSNVPNAELYS